MDNTKIRLSFIDSIGTPNVSPPEVNTYYKDMLEELGDYYLINHNDVEIEVGLLSVTSQYDKGTCKAWLAEFIRKTPDIFSLGDTLWENAADMESSLEKIYHYQSAGNLKLYSLTQLPPKYMMAVQNPKIILKYIDNYQGGSPGVEKLEALLKKEVYKNVEYCTKKGLCVIDTNNHLQRKSLKYMLELTVEKLDLPDQYLQEFKQFLQKISPYYDHSDVERNIE